MCISLKKVFITLFTLIIVQNMSFAQTGVSFVYINGSNNNDAKMRNWFMDGVTKMHPVMKKQFEKNKQIKILFLKNGQYFINSEPVIFFWGDKSQRDLSFVHQQLDISKALSPTIAYKVREVLASFLHDAIWVQKKHNMLPILDELNEVVKSENQKGNQVVLYGYSAGSFITYEYLFNKLPYLSFDKLFAAVDVSDDFRQFVKDNPLKNTCISALAKGQIGVVSADGHLLFDRTESRLKQNYLNMDKATDAVCSPEGSVRGIVNFASPLVLFYSDLADPEYELTFYNKLMLKYILEKDLFWLTVNYREDPLGFPTSKNLTIDEMSHYAKIDINDPKGFVYDNSGVWSKRAFMFAHTAYWTAGKSLPKGVIKAYINGYKFQYDPKFQQKVLKNDRARIKYEAL